MSQKFKRTIENFVCEFCGQNIIGDGYTNHCPFCLYSKHVDIHPGDREASCQGLMKPTEVEVKNHKLSIVHTCVLCGYQKKNKLSEDDNREVIFQLLNS
jgi:rubrerythrin